jgi:hypothetical protein
MKQAETTSLTRLGVLIYVDNMVKGSMQEEMALFYIEISKVFLISFIIGFSDFRIST